MQLFITGAAGFIGSHVVEQALARGHRVQAFDNLSSGKVANLPSVADGLLRLTVGDIRDAAAVDAAMQGCDAVLHLAAQVSVQASVQDPVGSAGHNLTGFLHVLDAARRQGIERLVYASSAAVYGTPAELPLTESSPTGPLSPYGLEKRLNEDYAALFGRLYGGHTLGLRFFNVYGPRQDAASPYAGVISKFCAALAEGRPLTVFGDGLQTRDFVYVGDVARLCVDALEGAQVGVLPVGTGRSVTLLDMVAALEQAAGARAELRHGPAQAGDIRHSAMRPDALQQAFGWVPQTSLEAGLGRLWSWWRAA